MAQPDQPCELERAGGSDQGDIWVPQLRPTGSTASCDNKARKIVKTATGEYAWAQVKYYDTNFELTRVRQDGRGIGNSRDVLSAVHGETGLTQPQSTLPPS